MTGLTGNSVACTGNKTGLRNWLTTVPNLRVTLLNASVGALPKPTMLAGLLALASANCQFRLKSVPIDGSNGVLALPVTGTLPCKCRFTSACAFKVGTTVKAFCKSNPKTPVNWVAFAALSVTSIWRNPNVPVALKFCRLVVSPTFSSSLAEVSTKKPVSLLTPKPKLRLKPTSVFTLLPSVTFNPSAGNPISNPMPDAIETGSLPKENPKLTCCAVSFSVMSPASLLPSPFTS